MESRRLLSAINGITAQPTVETAPNGLGSMETTNVTHPIIGSLTPNQVSQAYGFDQVAFNTGSKTVVGDGTGETIAIVDAHNDPNIASDLAHFDSQFNLPTANLTVVSQTGSSTSLPSTDAGWALEISLDVEWAHAMAPGAKILLVEANSDSLSDLLTGVQFASTRANVVSMSFGTNEFSGETAFDSIFNVPGVTFVAASGDSGGIAGEQYPAASPNVVGVGGTTLHTTPTGDFAGEDAWSGFSSEGSGGGVSQFEPEPAFQQSVLAGLLPARSTPDVSYNANPSTGFAVFDSLGNSGQSGWFQVGGTSAGTPQWAALVAIADQGRALSGQQGLSSQETLSELYSKASTEFQATKSPFFHDITSGFNAFFMAGQGYDLVTGLGSPIANALAPLLASAPTTAMTTMTMMTPMSSSGSSMLSSGSPASHLLQAAASDPVSQPSVMPSPTASTTSNMGVTIFSVAGNQQAPIIEMIPFAITPAGAAQTDATLNEVLGTEIVLSITSTLLPLPTPPLNVTHMMPSTPTPSTQFFLSPTGALTTTATTTPNPTHGQSLEEPQPLFLRSATEDQPLQTAVLNPWGRQGGHHNGLSEELKSNEDEQAPMPQLRPAPEQAPEAPQDLKDAPAPAVPNDQPKEPEKAAQDDSESTPVVRPAVSIGLVIGFWHYWERRKERPGKKRRKHQSIWY